MRIRFLSAAVLLLVAPAFAELPQTTHYMGTINGTLPVSLSIDDSNSGAAEGTYLYAHVGKALALDGNLGYNGYALAESNDDGIPTGNFKLSGTGGKLAGTWKSADGKKSYPVSLTAVAEAITLQSARSDRFDVTTRYLKFLGQGVGPAAAFRTALNDHLAGEGLDTHNASVKQLITDTDPAAKNHFEGAPAWSQERTPTVMYADDHLVSIRTKLYAFSGGARPFNGDTAENFAWINGSLAKLQLPDLVLPSAMEAFRTLCIQELKTQKAAWPEKIKWESGARPTINITASGLAVTFDPYVAGAWEEDFHVVVLPWEKLKAIVPDSSPVRELMR